MKPITISIFLVSILSLCQHPKARKPGAAQGETTFAKAEIIELLNYGYGLDVGSIRSDTSIDIVATDAKCNSRVLWLEFDKEEQTFKKYIIYQDDDTMSHAWFESLFIADVDLDGKSDVVVTSNRFPSAVVWFRNPGYPLNKEKWKLYPITHDFDELERWSNEHLDQYGRFYSATTLTEKMNEGDFPDIVTAPNNIDGDGIQRVKWFHHPGPGSVLVPRKWKVSTIESGFKGVRTVKSFHRNDESNQSILICDHGNSDVYVYYRKGETWKRDVLDFRTTCAPCHGIATDLNLDGNTDLLVAAGYKCGTGGMLNNAVVLYTGSRSAGYTKQIIHQEAHSPLEVAAKDIDLDQFPDVVIGTAYTPSEAPLSKILWCKNPGTPWAKPEDWRCTLLEDSLVVVNAIRIVDINGDGLDDILAVSSGNQKQKGRLMWFRNTSLSDTQ